MRRLRDDFAALVRDGDRCDLGRAALEIARVEYPDLDAERWLRELDALAHAARPRVDAGAPTAAVPALMTFLFEERGFRGNTDDYYDPRNSFLNDVLERRIGIPITLSVVAIETGTRLGLALEGVGFPGHFLIRAAGRDGPVFLDPFSGGHALGHDELRRRLGAFYDAAGGRAGHSIERALAQALSPTPAVGVLSRMLANLLRIYLDRDDRLRALAVVELRLVLAPDAPEHLRVRGVLYEQLERFDAAAADFRRCLELAPDAADAPTLRARIERLGRAPVTLH